MDFKATRDPKKQSGKVVDNSGMPLPGANVLIKGSTKGVQTDFDGKFKLNVSIQWFENNRFKVIYLYLDILEYFSPAVQLGLTATPKRQDNIDTYRYFGEPVYIYSLKKGINDGFLTPFKVKRIKTTLDDYEDNDNYVLNLTNNTRTDLTFCVQQFWLHTEHLTYLENNTLDVHNIYDKGIYPEVWRQHCSGHRVGFLAPQDQKL